MRGKFFKLAAIIAFASGSVRAANFCGELKNGFGPFDYRQASALPEQIGLVEGAHFTKEVSDGTRGKSSYLGGDLDYTLRAWPNHLRALATMSKVGLRDKVVQLQGAKWPVECYFERALRFAPDDGAVHAIYGQHLFAHGKVKEALAEFKQAVALDPENPTFNYNAGLAYAKLNDYHNASIHAKKAYSLGFPLPGLKNQLIKAGKWNNAAE